MKNLYLVTFRALAPSISIWEAPEQTRIVWAYNTEEAKRRVRESTELHCVHFIVHAALGTPDPATNDMKS